MRLRRFASFALANTLVGILALSAPSATMGVPQGRLTAAGGGANEHIGYSVAISGESALVGEEYDGKAYVFTSSSGTWTQQQTLTSPHSFNYSSFGSAVALDGDTAVIGARWDNVDSVYHQGAAFVFTRTGTTWSRQATLNAMDGEADDQFGLCVAVSGDTAVVGGGGAVYVFTRSAGTWTQQAKLTTTDGTPIGASSVALSGDTVVAGATWWNEQQGAAYVFTGSGSSWSQQARLTAADGASGEEFGRSVAVSGDTVLVGAPTSQGKAYVFTRSGTTWSQQQKLVPDDIMPYSWFGDSVALVGDTALIGSPWDKGNGKPEDSHGAAYVFTRSGVTWTKTSKMAPSAFNSWFGYSVALSPGLSALIGAPYDDVGSPVAAVDEGSAYVYPLAAPARTYDAVFGPGRCDTAVEASKRAFPDPGSADTIVLATGWNWPDALGGSSLAGAYGAPLLLTKPDVLSPQVVDEARRLDVHRVVILGSNKAVYDAVENALGSLDVNGHGLAVSRLGGGDRYATAGLIASATVDVVRAGGGTYDGTAFFATGAKFPDAVAASPIAASKRWPILLVKADGPSAPTEAAIAKLGITRGIMLGSDKAVSVAVANRLAELLPAPPDRLYGDSRYTTAISVARFGVANGLRWDGCALSTGTNFPDALAGGVMQAKLGSVVLLTPGTTLDTDVGAELTSHKASIATVRYLGSTSTLSQAVRDAVEDALE